MPLNSQFSLGQVPFQFGILVRLLKVAMSTFINRNDERNNSWLCVVYKSPFAKGIITVYGLQSTRTLGVYQNLLFQFTVTYAVMRSRKCHSKLTPKKNVWNKIVPFGYFFPQHLLNTFKLLCDLWLFPMNQFSFISLKTFPDLSHF